MTHIRKPWASSLGVILPASAPTVVLPRLVCCWCSPSHVMRDGPEPTSHGACPVAVAQLHAEMAATEGGMPVIIPKLVVHGQCLPSGTPPHVLRCQCGFVVVSRSIPASIVALGDHRAHAHTLEARV